MDLADIGWAATVAAVIENEPLEGSVWRLLLVFFLLLLSALFMAAGSALVRVRPGLFDEGDVDDERYPLAKSMVQATDAYFAVTQIGVTIVCVFLGFFCTPAIASLFGGLLGSLGLDATQSWLGWLSVGLALLLIVSLHVVFGALAPRAFATRRSLATSVVLSRPLRFFYFIFFPLVWLLNGSANTVLRLLRIDPSVSSERVHSAEELRHIVSETSDADEVTETEKDILLNALELNDLDVRDIMTPRHEVVALDIEKSFAANLQAAIDSKHTRFPLVRGDLDETVGLIHIKDVLPLIQAGKEPDFEQIMHPVHPVSEVLPVDRLLGVFRDRRAHLAVVVDEFGGAAGIVSLDDAMAEVVGDIRDEFKHAAEAAEFKRLSEDEFVAEGTLGLHELADVSDLELESEEVSTIGGYVTEVLGRLPTVGESLSIDGYEVTATRADERKVGQLRFRRAAA